MKPEHVDDPIDELLPWYVNGTLPPDERAKVEQHLASCSKCSRELELLFELRASMAELAEETPSVSAALARTLSTIDDSGKARNQESRVKSWFGRIWTPSTPWVQAAVAQFVVILVLAGAFFLTDKTPSHTTVSDPGGVSNAARLTVIFEPNTSEESIRRVLLSINGNVVSGPSSLGVYIVELSILKTDNSKIEAEIRKLRSEPAVIRFVERQP